MPSIEYSEREPFDGLFAGKHVTVSSKPSVGTPRPLPRLHTGPDWAFDDYYPYSTVAPNPSAALSENQQSALAAHLKFLYSNTGSIVVHEYMTQFQAGVGIEEYVTYVFTSDTYDIKVEVPSGAGDLTLNGVEGWLVISDHHILAWDRPGSFAQANIEEYRNDHSYDSLGDTFSSTYNDIGFDLYVIDVKSVQTYLIARNVAAVTSFSTYLIDADPLGAFDDATTLNYHVDFREVAFDLDTLDKPCAAAMAATVNGLNREILFAEGRMPDLSRTLSLWQDTLRQLDTEMTDDEYAYFAQSGILTVDTVMDVLTRVPGAGRVAGTLYGVARNLTEDHAAARILADKVFDDLGKIVEIVGRAGSKAAYRAADVAKSACGFLENVRELNAIDDMRSAAIDNADRAKSQISEYTQTIHDLRSKIEGYKQQLIDLSPCGASAGATTVSGAAVSGAETVAPSFAFVDMAETSSHSLDVASLLLPTTTMAIVLGTGDADQFSYRASARAGVGIEIEGGAGDDTFIYEGSFHDIVGHLATRDMTYLYLLDGSYIALRGIEHIASRTAVFVPESSSVFGSWLLVSRSISDLDSNGLSEILLQSDGSVVSWSLANGTYQSGALITSGAGAFAVKGTGDVDGDGTSDIILQNGGAVVDWVMKGGKFQAGNLITDGAVGYTVRAIGDFNGDGTADIALQNGSVVVDWIMKDGKYQSGNVVTNGLGAGFSVVGAGDFNGDGTSDLLLQNGGTVVEWLMKNGVYQSGGLITDGAAGFKVVGTGDFNGDGTSDILLQNGGTVVDWIMKNGAYQTGNVITTGAIGYDVKNTGDYDGDGTDDIVLQSGGTVVDWIMHDGKYFGGNLLTSGLQGYDVV